MAAPAPSTMAHTRPPVWAIVAWSVGVILVAIAVLGLGRAESTGGRLTRAAAVKPVTHAPVAHGELGDGRSGIGAFRQPANTTTTTVAPTNPSLAPLTIRIPAIGVTSPLISLGLNPDNTLEVPADFSVAGWYRYRPVPGEPGPAVIAGHVDSRVGPAVFYRLKELPPGAIVEVDRSDGSTAVFTVTGTEEHDKDAFPTERVYGPTAGAELRVITCGGTFDWSTRHYNDNIIVFATLAKIVRR